ncbi:MAG: hypothetical protein KatS3mg104_1680 [Phycisphaerae bacterium]|jgi:hypothetical protein|nr:MAG: hypothetical protein KatS3mg104_1680 [Phycisphaerae bacterium]
MRLFRTSVNAVLLVAITCQAQSSQPDYSTPQGVFRTYTQSIANGDIEELKKASVTTDKHQQLLKNQISYLATEKKFRETCIQAFPGATKELADPTQQTLQAIAKAEVKIDGDTAMLFTPDSPEPVRLKRIDNRWKVDLPAMYDDQAVDDILAFRSALQFVMNDLIDDIQKGKYKTFDELKNVLEIRVKMRMALPPAEESSDANPSTKQASS